MRRDEEPPAGAEVLDLGALGDRASEEIGDDSTSAGPPGGRVSRRSVVAAGGLVVAAGVLAVATSRPTATPPPQALPASSASPARPPAPVTSPASVTSQDRPVVTSLAHPLPGAKAGWSLFALGVDLLLRVELATGRVTRTALPALGGSPVSLIPARDLVIVQTPIARQRYVVPDGGAATPSDVGSDPMFPGPDPDHFWAAVAGNRGGSFQLVTLTGAATGITFAAPAFFANGIPDGAGSVVFEGVGGVYRVDGARGLLRVSGGMLTALGPTGLVALECDERARCASVVRNRHGGARELPVTLQRQSNIPGWLSPDLTTVALQQLEADDFAITLVDLPSGRQRRLPLRAMPLDSTATAAWSPDSRWLFVIDETAQLDVVDARTGTVRDLDRRLPPVTQLAFRS